MQMSNVGLRGLQLLRPQRFTDERGWFTETYNAAAFRQAGLPSEFAQDNCSCSQHGVLRGLHLQVRRPQGKLIRVLSGQIWDVAVDLRRDSATFGRWAAVELAARSADGDLEMLWVPEGFAHGFLVLSETAEVAYKVTRAYDPADEQTLLWNDPELQIIWPLDRIVGHTPTVSRKDAAGLSLSAVAGLELAR